MPQAHLISSPREWLEAARAEIEAALETAVPPAAAPPETLHLAVRYSLFAGGKRLRPLLCLAAASAARDDPRPTPPAALALAAAVELIHTYSLIHDDLPALDNDDFRRGRPACHKQFGEAAAILAGDALLTLAFQCLAQPEAAPLAAASVAALARAAGAPDGMVAGQAADLAATAETATLAEVTGIHRRKTAALIRCALELGGLAGGADPGRRAELMAAGEELGLAFQINDDILDVTAGSAALGKTAGKDAARGKATFPAVMDLEEARHHALGLGRRALARLARWPKTAAPLRALAQQMLARQR